jgi:type I restriction enzyme R subunit
LDLECLKKLKSDVIISGSHNDELHLKLYTDSSKHKASIKSFKLPFDGEDDGVRDQVMYLDKIIVAHGLLQAIARVNREPTIGL